MSNTVATQTNKVSKIESLKNILKAPSVQEQFNNALKENAGSFVASIIDLYNGDTGLQQCDPKLVVMEALKAAVLKLPVNKSLGFAYIIPYKAIPVFQLGYKGYIQMAMRTGQYKFINADIVYEGEIREVNKLTGEVDFRGEKKSDKIVGYFAYIELLNGFSKTLYMTKDRVTQHGKRYSKTFNLSTSSWATNFDEMALKTVIRNLLSHYGFLSVEMMTALDNDVQAESGESNENSKEIGIEEAEVISSSTPKSKTAEQVVEGPDF